MAYGDKWTTSFESADGYGYSVHIQQQGYTGAVETLIPAEAPVRYRLGSPRQTRRTIRESSLTIRANVDGGSSLRELRSASPFQYRILLKREGTTVWQGFPLAETFRDFPDSRAQDVEVTAYDGFGVLEDRDFDVEVPTSLMGLLGGALDQIPSWNEVETLVDWVPHYSSAIGDTLGEMGFLDPSFIGDTWHDVLTQLALSFGAELFQGSDGWYLLQPTELPSGTLTRRNLGGSTLSTGSIPQLDTAPIAVDTRPPRLGDASIQQYDVTYSFDGPASGLVLNPGFEQGLVSWSSTGGPPAVEVVDRATVGLSPSANDQQILQIGGTSTQQLERVAQTDEVYIWGSEASSIHLSFEVIGTYEASNAETIPVTVQVGSYRLTDATASIHTNSLQGDDVTLTVDQLHPGSFGSYADVPLIPEGAQLPIKDAGTNVATLTLTEEVRVGDTTVTGDLSAPVSAGHTLKYPYFDSGPRYDQQVPAGYSTAQYDAILMAPDGTRLDGLFRFALGNFVSTNPDLNHVRIDNIESDWQVDGRSVIKGSMPWRAKTGEGRVESSPRASRIGDGPWASGPSGLVRMSNQQSTIDDGLGWGRGSATLNGRSLAQHHAREWLAHTRDGQTMRELVLNLRNGQTYRPEQVLLQGSLNLWRSGVQWGVESGRVRITGRDLYRDGGGIEVVPRPPDDEEGSAGVTVRGGGGGVGGRSEQIVPIDGDTELPPVGGTISLPNPSGRAALTHSNPILSSKGPLSSVAAPQQSITRFVSDQIETVITSVDTTNDTFGVGDASWLAAGDTFSVAESTGNDATYTITSISGSTVSVAESITDSTADGVVTQPAWRLDQDPTYRVELDASNSTITDTLPDPIGTAIVYRTDDSSNTAEIQHENDIVTSSGVVGQLPLDPRETLHLHAVKGGATEAGVPVDRQWRLVGTEGGGSLTDLLLDESTFESGSQPSSPDVGDRWYNGTSYQYWDGSQWQLFSRNGKPLRIEEQALGPQTHFEKAYVNGRPIAGEVVWGGRIGEDGSLVDVTISVDVAPSASVTFSVVLNGAAIGTIPLSSGSGSMAFSQSLSVGDRLTVTAPDPADPVMEGIYTTVVRVA